MIILRLKVEWEKAKRGHILTPVHNPFLSNMSGRCTHCNPVVAFGSGASVNPILCIAVARCLMKIKVSEASIASLILYKEENHKGKNYNKS